MPIFKTYLWLDASSLALIGRASLFDAQALAVVGPAGGGSIWVIGNTYGTSNYGGFFLTTDAWQSNLAGSSDAFLAQFDLINPVVSSVGSSANGYAPFSAGQLISIYGSQLGSAAGAGPQLGPDGIVGTLNHGTRVLFDGLPAPILFARADQINTAIPCALSGHSITQMVVENHGVQTAPMTIPLNEAAPGVFTANGTGAGQGAILNQDYSINGPSNPASRGSTVMIYATGLGPTSPFCTDGKIYEDQLPQAVLPVVVGFGNEGAPVSYAGQAPFAVSGGSQINAVIPADAQTGAAVSVTLLVSGQYSRPGVTMAIK